jgi:hypothetical protein
MIKNYIFQQSWNMWTWVLTELYATLYSSVIKEYFIKKREREREITSCKWQCLP